MKRNITFIMLLVAMLYMLAVPVCAQSNARGESLDSDIDVRAMPYTATFYELFQIYDSMQLGWATIRVEVEATIDAQNGYIISVNRISATPRGESVNFVSWQVDSDDISYTIDNIHGAIHVTVTGLLTVEVAAPIIGTTIGNTSWQTISHSFNVY